MEKIQQLFTLLQANPWPTAAGIVILIWGVYENWDKIRAKFPTLNPAKETVTRTIPETPRPMMDDWKIVRNDVKPSITESLLAENERQQVFYYLERIRGYAESTGNVEASKDCVSLLNNLFKEFYPLKPVPTDVIDAVKGAK